MYKAVYEDLQSIARVCKMNLSTGIVSKWFVGCRDTDYKIVYGYSVLRIKEHGFWSFKLPLEVSHLDKVYVLTKKSTKYNF